MQDALLKTYQHVSQISDPDAFRTWLYTTVRNACLMKRRRRVGEPAHMVSIEQGGRTADGEFTEVEVPDAARGPEQQLQDSWAGQRLQTALQSLPPAYRAIVVMREIEGLPTREVAQISGLSEANVKQRLHRARVMLRQKLEA
jgi:RNA polymerase sigma-70 factor (ECF subfamily)